eukprot:gene15170-14967_t
MLSRLIVGLALILGLAACSTASPQAVAARRQPNVIVILADDRGYGDLSPYGGWIPTPNITALAASGARFTDGYVSAAVCAPSRAALLTGRPQTRFGFEFNPVGRDATGGLSLDETTLAQVMKGAGYATGMVGKWHIGSGPGYHPLDRGFDSYFGILGGAGDFWAAQGPGDLFAPIGGDEQTVRARSPVVRGRAVVEEPRYLTEAFTDEAAQFVRQNRERPFFLYLAFNAPHTPLQATKEDYEALKDIPDHTTRVYGAMIRALDRNVGKVLAELEKQGLADDTIVIFTSDNGGANYIGLRDINKPFRGWKATFFEGGVNVPFFMKWPGHVEPGSVSPTRAMHIDIFATAAHAAGAQVGPKVDGVDLLTLLSGKAAPRPLFFRSGHYRAVIDGDWKLQLSERPKQAWLFNLAADPTERKNLSASEPAQLARLTALLDEQDRRAGKPLWPALVEAPFFIDEPLNKERSMTGEYVMWAN